MSAVASPVKKAPQTIRAPLHVNLRTQQRRLRHVRSISIRNLVPVPRELSGSSSSHLDIKIRFSLHEVESSNIALYTSCCLQETYNPTWGSLVLDYGMLNQHSVLSKFVVKVWQVIGDGDMEQDVLCFEKYVDLHTYIFLGLTMVRIDSANYPPNSVIIGMPEGFFVNSRDGGYPSPRRPSFHRIMEFLPPQSLIEVKRAEVIDSYTMNELKRLLAQQTVLDKLRKTISNDKTRLQTIRINSELRLKQKEEITDLASRCELLKKLIDEHKQNLYRRKEKLTELTRRLDQREEGLKKKQDEYKESSMKFEKHQLTCSQKRDNLIKTQRKMYLRQRVMIAELAETFCIREKNNTFTICGVILPNGDPTEGGGASPEQIGVALGFVTHLVYLLARFLLVPLQYTLQPSGSKSTVLDDVHDEQSLDFKEFPLYLKGVDKSLFQFGLYLLWRDILQLRQHCGYGNSRSSTKKTLPNLKALLDRLVKDRYSVSPLSEITPPSISITGPTVSNPSPYTSSYYFAGSSYLSGEGTGNVTPTFDGSPSKSDDNTIDNQQYTPPQNRRESSSSKGSNPSSSPLMLKRSPQIRRHTDGFVLRNSLSFDQPQGPSSQSPEKDGSIYALDVSRTMSNADQTLMNLNSESSKIYSCSPTDIELLGFSPSPPRTNSPKLSNKHLSNNLINPASIELESVTSDSNTSQINKTTINPHTRTSDNGSSNNNTLNGVCSLPPQSEQQQLAEKQVNSSTTNDVCPLPPQRYHHQQQLGERVNRPRTSNTSDAGFVLRNFSSTNVTPTESASASGNKGPFRKIRDK